MCDTVNAKRKTEGESGEQSVEGRSCRAFHLPTQSNAEGTEVMKGGEKVMRCLQPLGGPHRNDHSWDIKVYLINKTPEGL